MQLIALRTYDLDGHRCRDGLYLNLGNRWALKSVCEGHPDEESERWDIMTAAQARDWLEGCEEQPIGPFIEHA